MTAAKALPPLTTSEAPTMLVCACPVLLGRFRVVIARPSINLARELAAGVRSAGNLFLADRTALRTNHRRHQGNHRAYRHPASHHHHFLCAIRPTLAASLNKLRGCASPLPSTDQVPSISCKTLPPRRAPFGVRHKSAHQRQIAVEGLTPTQKNGKLIPQAESRQSNNGPIVCRIGAADFRAWSVRCQVKVYLSFCWSD